MLWGRMSQSSQKAHSIRTTPPSGTAFSRDMSAISGKAAMAINYSTSAVGSIKVEVQDEHGVPIAGFGLAEATEIYGDEIERAVSWKQGADLSRLAGRVIRLRFVMKDADLYSIRIISAPIHSAHGSTSSPS